MKYVKVSFRLIHLYVFILFLLITLIYSTAVGIYSGERILGLIIPISFSGLIYYWKRKSFFELYEISENHIKVYYSFFGFRLRIFFLQFEKVFKTQRFQYKLKDKDKIYYLELNLEIEETEIIILNGHQRQLFKSFNLDFPNRKHLDTFESIFDGLSENKDFS